MARAVCFDVTHLVARLMIRSPSGIDKVDQAYGGHFAARSLGPAVHYGLRAPHVLAPARMQQIMDLVISAPWEAGHAGSSQDGAFAHVETWLAGPRQVPLAAHADKRPGPSLDRLIRSLQRAWLRVLRDPVAIPEGAVYLNVAQLVFEYPMFFRWLQRRPDVRPVFLIHDLLPLDHPEYFRPGYRARFNQRMGTAARYGAAFITTTDVVRDRLQDEMRRRGPQTMPIHVAPLPTTLRPATAQDPSDPHLARIPYFVVLGTIEARKNHLLLLNIWRQFAEGAGPVPKLVIVGARGWENEQVFDILDRGLLTRPHVIEVSGLGTAALIRLLKNARALLMPSWAEGYGLPIAEALTLGTPVVASQIPVFHEVSQGCAILKHPFDGVGWRETIKSLIDGNSPALRDVRAQAARFSPPTWPDYFRGVEEFLQSH